MDPFLTDFWGFLEPFGAFVRALKRPSSSFGGLDKVIVKRLLSSLLGLRLLMPRGVGLWLLPRARLLLAALEGYDFF